MKKFDFRFTKVKPDEVDDLVRVSGDALFVSRNDQKLWTKIIRENGINRLRAVRVGKRIVGGLLKIYWGHYFGGRSVDAVGIGAVGVLPEYRRSGAASFMMSEMLKEIRQEKIPISSLYPASIPLYRKVGYEIAVEQFISTINLKNTGVKNYLLDVEPVKSWKNKEILGLYSNFVNRANGRVNRDEVTWKYLMQSPWSPSTFSYLIKRGNTSEGYVIFSISKEKEPIFIRDYAAVSRDALERIITLLSDHSTMTREAVVRGASKEPLTMILPEQDFEIKKHEPLMLRIVSVKDALESRGYPTGISSEFQLEIYNDFIEENNGRFILKISDGKGKVISGGEGRIRMDIRTLSQIYSSFMSPRELRIYGSIDGPENELVEMETAFSGPYPWIRDNF